ncbi:MAG: ABC transporter substrate-binding protein [Phycisphaerae bacterium]|nr:ABC transporter substrate-binding protein [Saprospiraceae bacterium]
MKKFFLFTFIAIICGVIYLVNTTSKNTPQVAAPSGHIGHVERIISLCKHPIPIIIMGLDASDRRLVGIHPVAKLSMQSNVLYKYFTGLQKISDKICSKSFSPNIEELIRLKPDMILNWSRYAEAIAQMQGFGFNVVGINYDGSDQNDRDMIHIVAQAMGREAMADSIMQLRDSTLRQIRTVSDNILSEKRPKVIFFYNYETLCVGGEKCYENFCINLAGGRNMGAGLGIDRCVNLEQILEWDPDIILFGGWLNTTDPEDIYQNPILADLSAVRNRRVFKAPIWASNESILIWKWMAELIQPDLFDYNMREEIRTSYSWQYKINLTESDIDQVLFYQANAASPFYTKFNSKD